MTTPKDQKYIVIKTEKVPFSIQSTQDLIKAIQDHPECVIFGERGSEDEFFVLMLKDLHASCAIDAYSTSLLVQKGFDDPSIADYKEFLQDLYNRAGEHSPFCKEPD